MNRTRTIKALSTELAVALGSSIDELVLITRYIRAATVAEMERSAGKTLRIYQKINPKSGIVLEEYWGAKEVWEENNFSAHFETVQRAIDRACSGDRATAYGFLWKKL